MIGWEALSVHYVKTNACISKQNRKTNRKFEIIINLLLIRYLRMVFSGKEGITLEFLFSSTKCVPRYWYAFQIMTFLFFFKYKCQQMPCSKLFINLACSVCAEKYRTSVFLYKPRPHECFKRQSKENLSPYFSLDWSAVMRVNTTLFSFCRLFYLFHCVLFRFYLWLFYFVYGQK
jgi:hypothetical protein